MVAYQKEGKYLKKEEYEKELAKEALKKKAKELKEEDTIPMEDPKTDPAASKEEDIPPTISTDNPLLEAMATAEIMMEHMLAGSVELMKKKEVIALGMGMVSAGLMRYILMHPEIIEKGLEQIGNSLEIGGQAAGGGLTSLSSLLSNPEGLAAIASLLAAGGLTAATVTPGVPPPP